MNVTPSPHSVWIDSSADDRFTSFFASLRRHWLLFSAVLTATVAAAILLAFLLPSYWRAEITVMPVPSGNGVNVSSALGGLAGLSGLGGLGALLGRPASNQDEALAVLRSRELFDLYATQKNLLPVLYDGKWDASAGHWTVSGSQVPTLRRAYKLFDSQIRDIDVDRRSNIVILSITWKDRQQAVQWARDLIALTNSQLRQRALEDAQRNMNYLNEQMRRAAAGGAQNALTAALAGSYDRELQNFMSAKGQADFAFRIIDAPTIPDERERVFPNRPVFAALGLIGGLGLAFIAVWLADGKTRRGRKRASAL